MRRRHPEQTSSAVSSFRSVFGSNSGAKETTSGRRTRQRHVVLVRPALQASSLSNQNNDNHQHHHSNNKNAMIVSGLKFNCLARWKLQQSMIDPNHGKGGEGIGGESWLDILNAMEGNTSVTDLYLGPYFYSSMSAEQLDFFMKRCAKHLNQLRVLSIGTLETTQTRIPASIVGTSFLRGGASMLQTLRIERDLLLSNDQEVLDLADGFRHHRTLQRVSLSSLHPLLNMMTTVPLQQGSAWTENKNNNKLMYRARFCLDPLFESLATMQNLESLQCGLSGDLYPLWEAAAEAASEGEGTITTTPGSTWVVSPQAVSKLGSLPRLSWLVLSRLHIGDEHVIALCATLDSNQAQVEVDHLSLSSRSVAPIKIMDLTKTPRNGITERSWQAVLNLLQNQVHLEALDMFCPVPQTLAIKQQVTLYLKLNREGRRQRLRETSNKQEWVDLVARYFSNDLTLLTVVLRESPWVCIRNS